MPGLLVMRLKRSDSMSHVPVKKGEKPSAPKNVINLMDALRRSVQEEKPAKVKKGKKRIPGQGEILLPIAGKKKEAAKDVKKPAVRRKAG